MCLFFKNDGGGVNGRGLEHLRKKKKKKKKRRCRIEEEDDIEEKEAKRGRNHRERGKISDATACLNPRPVTRS